MLEQLVDAGKVHLSDPAEKYFPEIKAVQGRFPDAPPITLVQLATHTSGLGREPDNTETYLTGAVADWSTSRNTFSNLSGLPIRLWSGIRKCCPTCPRATS